MWIWYSDNEQNLVYTKISFKLPTFIFVRAFLNIIKLYCDNCRYHRPIQYRRSTMFPFLYVNVPDSHGTVSLVKSYEWNQMSWNYGTWYQTFTPPSILYVYKWFTATETFVELLKFQDFARSPNKIYSNSTCNWFVLAVTECSAIIFGLEWITHCDQKQKVTPYTYTLGQ